MKKEPVTPLKEKLISFETAKLAKEKGFDIPQNKMFSATIDRSIFNKTDNPEIVKFHNGDKHQCANTPHDWNNTKSIISTKYYSAPTQSLLQKWLREVHEISVKIDDYYTNSRVRFDYNVCELGSQEDNPVGIFETYEEALEAGLQEALKLIKS